MQNKSHGKSKAKHIEVEEEREKMDR